MTEGPNTGDALRTRAERGTPRGADAVLVNLYTKPYPQHSHWTFLKVSPDT